MTKHSFVVVVADDDPYLVELYQFILIEAGHQVLCCFSGNEAERVIRRVKPDVAIVDMQMEAQDAGLRLLETIRANPETSRVAVIVCSADVLFLDAQREHIARHGGETIAKPFEIDHLLATVERLVAF